MCADFNPIDAFVGPGGKKLVFKTAFTWNRDNILAFLKDASDNPADYGVPDPTVRKPDLQVLYTKVNELKFADGTGYLNPKPEQQVLRSGSNLVPSQAIPWAANDKKKEFFIIFDLLGAFLSLLGPAPTNATAKNYFLPLVVVYARWCIVLSPGSGFAPTVAQITWATKDSRLYPFLGTSAKGFAFEAGWPGRVKRKRWDLLNGVLQSPYLAYNSAPELRQETNGAYAGWRFGNCGETYPFLYLLTDATIRTTSFGIAISIGHTAENPTKPATQHPNVYDGQKYWKVGPIKPPCGNCEQLLKWFTIFDARLKYFKLYANPT